METLAPGMIVEAIVERVEPYGAWIDCQGRRGLVTIPEVSWSRIRHPADVLSVGDRIQVKVLGVASNQFAASIRACSPELDPWHDPTAFSAGREFVGRVVLKTAYGCFIELRPEVWGLLPLEKCPEEPSVGGQLRVVVQSADVPNRKIELSLVTAST